jgi:hypothetical protein
LVDRALEIFGHALLALCHEGHRPGLLLHRGGDLGDLRLGQECLRQTAIFTRSEKLADYATIPIDNMNSVRMANGAGWQTPRTNRRFYVLKLE